METIGMRVTKRDGELEEIAFDKILTRIKKLGQEVNIQINYQQLVMKVIDQLYDNISTTKIDELAAEQCASLSTLSPDYGTLAGRIIVSNHQKNTKTNFSDVMDLLYNFTDVNGEFYPLVSSQLWEFVQKYKTEIDDTIDYNRDYLIDYFGFKTLERSYLFKKNDVIVERPQHMWMRVSIQLHSNNFSKVQETYNALSQGYFIHATPTLFNSGTDHPQLSSCFLLTMSEDSIKGIYKTLGDCAQISKWAGGIGLAIHDIRARKSKIRGTNGESTGIIPMLKVFNDTAKYVNQGGKRNGSFAIYIEPWHADIEEFLKLRLNQGAEEDRARDLFYGLWIPDLFMKRLENNEDWTLMCPDECPGLSNVWGQEFEDLYTKYEVAGKGRKSLKASKIWQLVLESQIQTGTPYLCYKDAANSKSNQQHLGTIKSSNLCTEIMEYTAPDESAVCNLGSLALPKFIEAGVFNFDKLREYTRILTRNLDIVIDKNYYPTPECKKSNMNHRPIGIGIQGLADVFAILRLPWTSKEAANLNKEIFENIYYAAASESMIGASSDEWRNISIDTYPSFHGSPVNKGKLQFDLWNETPMTTYLDWNQLRKQCSTGMRNSLLIAPMPTASTSQILGNNECFEPFTSNIYTRRVLAGDFMVVNKYLVNDLVKLGLWTSEIRSSIIANNGSIQDLPEIPGELRELYKTAWEIPQKTLINMSRDRAPFICQSQSLNLFVADPSFSKVSSMHMYAWKKGLKTGCYYLRTKAVATAQKFTIEPTCPVSCLTCSA